VDEFDASMVVAVDAGRVAAVYSIVDHAYSSSY
jgi:hypothetical protein